MDYINKKTTINALEKILKMWKEEVYCDKDGLCDFCKNIVDRIERNIEKVKKHKNPNFSHPCNN